MQNNNIWKIIDCFVFYKMKYRFYLFDYVVNMGNKKKCKLKKMIKSFFQK